MGNNQPTAAVATAPTAVLVEKVRETPEKEWEPLSFQKVVDDNKLVRFDFRELKFQVLRPLEFHNDEIVTHQYVNNHYVEIQLEKFGQVRVRVYTPETWPTNNSSAYHTFSFFKECYSAGSIDVYREQHREFASLQAVMDKHKTAIPPQYTWYYPQSYSVQPAICAMEQWILWITRSRKRLELA